MNKRKTYSGEFKSKLVIDLIRGRESLRDLAAQNGIHPNQLKNWKSQFMKCAEFMLEDKRRRRKQSQWSMRVT